MPSIRTRVGSVKGSLMNEKAIQVFDFDGWAWKGQPAIKVSGGPTGIRTAERRWQTTADEAR